MDLWYCEKEIESADRMIEQWKTEIGEGFDVNFMRFELLSESLKHIQREDEFLNLSNNGYCDDDEECDDEEECDYEEYEYSRDCATPISPAACEYFSFVSECSDDEDEDEYYSDDEDDEEDFEEEDNCVYDNMDTVSVICDQNHPNGNSIEDTTADNSEKGHPHQDASNKHMKTFSRDLIHDEYIGGLLHEFGPCSTHSNTASNKLQMDDHEEGQEEEPSSPQPIMISNCDTLSEQEMSSINSSDNETSHSCIVNNKQTVDFSKHQQVIFE
ncbi:hypothetical protein FDP41_000597 [Naegleria fowleri]|uniref:Uncharacterized protein n=1 Tax=Naegleria fowleri TaxID=5763 RepID=A0A6A5CHF9_NAEFO|nr:uncharacterized protein FDP41_000597 [Naegleria fowleri]KAF0984698.1 hypothetical protein FDP41_000597 [Naegleria fowleri]